VAARIPWIFRLPEGTSLEQAVKSLSAAIAQAGPNRSSVREILASKSPWQGFDSHRPKNSRNSQPSRKYRFVSQARRPYITDRCIARGRNTIYLLQHFIWTEESNEI
jgi:hypothetical protein